MVVMAREYLRGLHNDATSDQPWYSSSVPRLLCLWMSTCIRVSFAHACYICNHIKKKKRHLCYCFRYWLYLCTYILEWDLRWLWRWTIFFSWIYMQCWYKFLLPKVKYGYQVYQNPWTKLLPCLHSNWSQWLYIAMHKTEYWYAYLSFCSDCLSPANNC